MQGWRGMRKEIREILAQYAEEDYKDFSAGLIPGAKPLMGVRLPQLRQIARSIANDREDPQRWRRETESCEGAYEDVYFEETMLRGMLIGYGTARKAFPYEDGVLYLSPSFPRSGTGLSATVSAIPLPLRTGTVTGCGKLCSHICIRTGSLKSGLR